MKPMSTRAQAALFDGILFLLLVMFSVSMVYAYLTVYGNAQEKTLRSSHELNYMQSVVKALYTIDVSTLNNVTQWEVKPTETINPAYADLDCTKTESYKGQFSVAELLKKDLNDFSGVAGANATCGGPSYLDDKFGGSSSASDAPGTTALRCALKEIMKPLTFAGMEYLAEVYDQCDFRVKVFLQGGVDNVTISNRPLSAIPTVIDCETASTTFNDVFSVSAPFRIRADITDISGGIDPKTFRYTLRICVWRKPS